MSMSDHFEEIQRSFDDLEYVDPNLANELAILIVNEKYKVERYSHWDQFLIQFIEYLTDLKFYEQDREAQESIMKLFDLLSDSYDFDAFTERITTLSAIIVYIKLSNNPVVLSSLSRLILKASPIDILANTELIKVLMSKLNSTDVSISVVTVVEAFIKELADRGELIRRRLVSNEIVQILDKMRHSSAEIMTRSFDLIQNVYLTFITQGELPDSLWEISNSELNDDDIAKPLSILHYYNNILDNILQRDLKWLLDKLNFDVIVKFMQSDHIFKDLFINEFIIMLGKLSYCEEKFSELDLQYHFIDKAIEEYEYDANYVYLLSLINRKILSRRSEFLSSLTLSKKTLSIYANLIPDETIFNSISITTRNLEKLPSFIELLYIVEKMSEYKWSAISLLKNYPLIMNKLLDTPTTDHELLESKKQTLVNLLLYQDDLDIWTPKIKTELLRLINGGSQPPQVTVSDSTL